MTIFRITKKEYANAFDGKGAARFGNRWNSKGTKVIYCAESRALAFAELSVYLNMSMASTKYVMLTIDVPEKIPIKMFEQSGLPIDWNAYPHIKDTQTIGDRLVEENKFALIKVPSAIVHGDNNFIINPRHQNFKLIKVVDEAPFQIDQRAFN